MKTFANSIKQTIQQQRETKGTKRERERGPKSKPKEQNYEWVPEDRWKEQIMFKSLPPPITRSISERDDKPTRVISLEEPSLAMVCG
jgi:hypothetical protein